MGPLAIDEVLRVRTLRVRFKDCLIVRRAKVIDSVVDDKAVRLDFLAFSGFRARTMSSSDLSSIVSASNNECNNDMYYDKKRKTNANKRNLNK